MDVRVYESQYKDQNCIVLENERLLVKVLPQMGGKLQSIFDKQKNKEYLYQSPWDKYRKSEYDTLFENGEFSGFDEMFPTISECFYPTWPWRGVKAPDHGEVWSIKWDYAVERNSLLLAVCGVRFPYRLQKRVEFTRENSIRITYKAENLSDFDFDFIWAAHPLFNCNENTVIVLPKSVERIINTFGGRERLGEFGALHPWPKTTTISGKEYDMSKICAQSSGTCEKYYVLGRMQEGWCALHDTKTGDVVALSYPVDKVPYLGMWVNEGGYWGQYNVAPEPCTGALDRVDTAKQWDQVGTIKAKSEYDWFLNITFDSAAEINFVDEYGVIK